MERFYDQLEFILYGTNNIISQILSLSGDNQGRLGIRMEHSILIFKSLGGEHDNFNNVICQKMAMFEKFKLSLTPH